MAGSSNGTRASASGRYGNWRRTLAVVWLGEVLSIAGFNAVIPFLPFYVRQLGITGPGEVELWSGLLISGQAWTMFIMGPIWGTIADRVSRKMMLQRAMYGGALLLGAMGYVTNVQQLLALRVAQGAVTGTVSAAFSLIASCTPEEQRTPALGVLQMGVYVGGSLGPALGGIVADLWGFRASFTVTAALLVLGGILITTMVHEVKDDGVARDRSLTQGVRVALGSAAVLSVFSVSILLRIGLRTTAPVLALFAQMLDPTQTKTASIVGLVSSFHMAGTAVGALIAGRFGNRLGIRRLLLLGSAGCLVAYSAHAWCRNTTQLLVLYAMAGVTAGSMLTGLSTALANAAPEGRQGVVFGLDSSINSVANAIGPMIGAATAVSFGLRMPWIVSGGMFGLALLVIGFRSFSKARPG